jgi:non-heme chloroperoxidase
MNKPGKIHLHYETSGNGGVPVVLVHGYSMSSAVWEKALPLFKPRYRLFAIDLRGFGRSDKPETGYRCSELAEDIKIFMDDSGLSQAVLIGHSFGGQVVQHFAAAYPERILALVLSNTVAATLPPVGITADAKQRINGYGSGEDNRKVLSANIPRYFDAANVTGEDIEHFIGIGLQAGSKALRETLKANHATPAVPKARYADFKAPVLILVSTHDSFGIFDHATAMSDSFPNSRIEVITGCGHTPMWEKPSEFADRVMNFLKDLKSNLSH